MVRRFVSPGVSNDERHYTSYWSENEPTLFSSSCPQNAGAVLKWFNSPRHSRCKQGTHGDENLGEVDVLLPGATFVEKEAIYVNTEGRPQR